MYEEKHKKYDAVIVIWLIYEPELLFSDMKRKQDIFSCK